LRHSSVFAILNIASLSSALNIPFFITLVKFVVNYIKLIKWHTPSGGGLSYKLLIKLLQIFSTSIFILTRQFYRLYRCIFVSTMTKFSFRNNSIRSCSHRIFFIC
jgi:hypothetical protein